MKFEKGDYVWYDDTFCKVLGYWDKRKVSLEIRSGVLFDDDDGANTVIIHEDRLRKENTEDLITIYQLKELSKAVRKDGLSIAEWKLVVKAFADEHKLEGKEAIRLSRIAKEHFIWE